MSATAALSARYHAACLRKRSRYPQFEVEGDKPLPVQDVAAVLRALRRAADGSRTDRCRSQPNPPRSVPRSRKRTALRIPHGKPHPSVLCCIPFQWWNPDQPVGRNRSRFLRPEFQDEQVLGHPRKRHRRASISCVWAASAFHLAPVSPDADETFGLSRNWRSVTPYCTRSTTTLNTRQSATDFITADLETECARRSLPIPQMVQVVEIREGLRGSISGFLELTFRAAVRGPLLLGRGSHFGAGLFRKL